jgi:hypothetical protein
LVHIFNDVVVAVGCLLFLLVICQWKIFLNMFLRTANGINQWNQKSRL